MRWASYECVREDWFRAACRWSAGLVLFFFATYALAAWASFQRPDVPSVVFDWERRIPFLPWTIVPYWSTDALFVLAPFLFRTREEMAVHGKRILAVQAISVLFFLAFPLQFSFGRPTVDGVFGWMFFLRTGFDVQFNQAPSLHVGFMVVLWAAYARVLRGWGLWVMRGWFLLTILSTLTTYRHHFIDVATGVPVGLACIAMWQMEPDEETPDLVGEMEG